MWYQELAQVCDCFKRITLDDQFGLMGIKGGRYSAVSVNLQGNVQ